MFTLIVKYGNYSSGPAPNFPTETNTFFCKYFNIATLLCWILSSFPPVWAWNCDNVFVQQNITLIDTFFCKYFNIATLLCWILSSFPPVWAWSCDNVFVQQNITLIDICCHKLHIHVDNMAMSQWNCDIKKRLFSYQFLSCIWAESYLTNLYYTKTWVKCQFEG